MKNLSKLSLIFTLILAVVFAGCKKEDDAVPNEGEEGEEDFTDVILTFTNDADANDTVVWTAIDKDGKEGATEQPVLTSTTPLGKGKTYTLEIKVINNLDGGEDITAEDIGTEDGAAEHQLFFSFPEGTFTSPAGDGNIDAIGTDAVNYLDKDVNGLPLGLKTKWTVADAEKTGKFRVQLNHQPKLKTATSTSATGDDDFNYTFDFEVK